MAAINSVVTRGFSIGTIALVALRGYTPSILVASFIDLGAAAGAFTPNMNLGTAAGKYEPNLSLGAAAGKRTPNIDLGGSWLAEE